MTNPYEALGSRAFWRSAVGGRSAFDMSELWIPKYQIARNKPWVTFGSCFAQHLSAALVRNGFDWRNFEAAPTGVEPSVAKEFNYGVFSARTGNIYTTSLLLQWVRWALGHQPVPDEIWETDGRFFDPFRPVIEAGGFSSREEVLASREATLESFRKCIENARYFVFTLGLTESWHNAEAGYEYPMCPGTAAGQFDPDRHAFHNMSFRDVTASLSEATKLMRRANPSLRFLLTVSPVPLTATYSGNHVLVATTYSKSLLRVAAEQIAQGNRAIDYFPSFEIINAHPFKGMFYEPNLRSVNRRGVDFVMEQFFSAVPVQTEKGGARESVKSARAGVASKAAAAQQEDEVVCEEQILEAFGRA